MEPTETAKKIRNIILFSFFLTSLITIISIMLNNYKLENISELSYNQTTITSPQTFQLLSLQSETHKLFSKFNEQEHNADFLNDTKILNTNNGITITNLSNLYKKEKNIKMTNKIEEYNQHYLEYFSLAQQSESEKRTTKLTELEVDLNYELNSFIIQNKKDTLINFDNINQSISEINTQSRSLYAVLFAIVGLCFFYIDRTAQHI